MLTRALFLAAGWLIASFLGTLLFGRRSRNRSRNFFLGWLTVVLLSGNLWGIFTFGIPLEIIGLSILAYIIGWWWHKRLPNWNAFGQVTWIMTLLTTLLYAFYVAAVTIFTPLHPGAFILAILFLFIEFFALGLMLSFVYEGLDMLCRVQWHRRTQPMRPISGYAPKVSLHVPAYNEPPELVEKTLRLLAKLNYPNYEVLVIDNNTPQESSWRPLEAVCRELGSRFRCLHLEKWPGYKSGALNFALTQTAPDVEIIGIIDADYQVLPSFLRETIPAFINSEVAFVQTPQDYREYEGNSFLEAAYYGYKYFFEITMPSRNERNAIIFAGTMGLIRRSVLQEIGGWDEWCITEDAEASLRILNRGYKAIYINKAYGKGLIPFTFDDFKKQRFRWCFGGVQLLKKHWELLMPWSQRIDPKNKLTGAQRYYYLIGGLQWYNDLLNLLFAFFLIVGSVLALLPDTEWIRPLTGPFLVMPAGFLFMGLWRFLWVLRNSLKLNWRTALMTMGNFFSLGWAVTLGSIQGLIQREGVFLRTAKAKSDSGIIRAIKSTQWETGIGLTCAIMAVATIFLQLNVSSILLFILLIWQASLFLSAPLYSLLSIRDGRPRSSINRADIQGKTVWENRAARMVVSLVLVVIIGGLMVPTNPSTEQSTYSQLKPIDIPAQQLFGLQSVPLNERGNPTPTLVASPTPTKLLTAVPTETLAPIIPTATPPQVTPTVPVEPTSTITPTALVTPTVTITPTVVITITITPTVPMTPTITITPTIPVTTTSTPIPFETPVTTSTPTTSFTPTASPIVTITTTPALTQPPVTQTPTPLNTPTAVSTP